MKFENHTLRKVENVQVGDVVAFEMRSANYRVSAIETTPVGMIRHRHDTGSSSYWPGELVYVENKRGENS